MTTVINVRGKKRAELLADPDFLYVGRAVGRAGWKASKWGNPFTVAAFGLDAVSMYEVALTQGEDRAWQDLRLQLPELKGKTLGCWCCDYDGTGPPERPCHAVVLARLADGLDNPPL
jgi:hypothetical protein